VGQEKVTILLRVIETKIIGNDFLAGPEGLNKKTSKLRPGKTEWQKKGEIE
jgi:hypothetical protein